MNSRLKNTLVTSILIAVLFPAVVGITWLATFGGIDFMVVIRTTPIILLSGIIACISIIAGIDNFNDNYGI